MQSKIVYIIKLIKNNKLYPKISCNNIAIALTPVRIATVRSFFSMLDL
jgi:hypothetical protein